MAQFRILAELGRGGMGVVYRAEDEKLGRIVALKVLPGDFDHDEARRRRFLREARVAASITHPNVATVHEVGEADGRIYIAMELVEGSTLRRRIEERGALGLRESLRIAREIARGVSKAHTRGIAHRDLKPDNVMVSDESVKVLDFGLATPVSVSSADRDAATWTQEGRIVGTPGYMSPEQAAGRAVDVRTDVFSLGVVLYEMLTGTRPFKGETGMEVVIATSRDTQARASTIDASISGSLDAVLDRCLEKLPEDRYPTIDALLEDLSAAAAADHERPATGSAATGPTTPPWSRRLLVAAVAASAVVAGLWWLTRPGLGDGLAASTAAHERSAPATPSQNAGVPAPPSATERIASSASPPASAPSLLPIPAVSTPGAQVARRREPSQPNARAFEPRSTSPRAATDVTTEGQPAASSAPAHGGVIEKSPY